MLFTPENERLWDTWIVVHEGVYHLFYLRISATGRRWDGMSVATSTDLIHWHEEGPVIEKPPEATWLGTGSVSRVDDWWILNCSQELPGTPPEQVIRFARSRHLLHGWEPIPDVTFRAESRYYEHVDMPIAEPTPRWDCITPLRIPGRDPEWIGYFTANARDAHRGRSGCAGLAESTDCVHWKALPPAVPPGLFSNCEVIEHLAFGPRHYLLFASNTGAGYRFDSRSRGNAGGTWYVVGDDPEGPFTMPPHDPLLQGSRQDRNVFMLYVGRPFRSLDGELLYGHHWERFSGRSDGSWGPAKTLIEVEPWRLGLGWWSGNDALKGVLLAEAPTPTTCTGRRPFHQLPVAEWLVEDGQVCVQGRGGCWTADWSLPQPSGCDAGRLLETGLRIDDGAAMGVWVGTEPEPGRKGGPAAGGGPGPDDFMLAVFCDHEAQVVSFCRLTRCFGPSLVVEQHIESVSWPICRKATHQMRLLVRERFLECYLDDRFVHGISIPEAFDTTRIGFVTDRADGRFVNARVWAMPSLSSIGRLDPQD